jgi:hypothetical protein
MSILKKLAKSGMFGVAGLAATNKDAANKIARKGGLGLAGMLMAKKKRAAEKAGAMPGRSMTDEVMGNRGAPVMGRERMDEEAPTGAPAMRKGGKVKKMAKGGSTASKRADGCATKGKTKGRFV